LASQRQPAAFLQSPAQVGFSPDGSKLVITMKGNGGGSVYVYACRLTAASPIHRDHSVGGNAFAFVFDPQPVGDRQCGVWQSVDLHVNRDGSLTLVSVGASDRQIAACWVTVANGNYYAANAGSGSLSQYTIDATVRDPGHRGTTASRRGDMAASNDGRFLYAQSGGADRSKPSRSTATGRYRRSAHGRCLMAEPGGHRGGVVDNTHPASPQRGG